MTHTETTQAHDHYSHKYYYYYYNYYFYPKQIRTGSLFSFKTQHE